MTSDSTKRKYKPISRYDSMADFFHRASNEEIERVFDLAIELSIEKQKETMRRADEKIAALEKAEREKQNSDAKASGA